MARRVTELEYPTIYWQNESRIPPCTACTTAAARKVYNITSSLVHYQLVHVLGCERNALVEIVNTSVENFSIETFFPSSDRIFRIWCSFYAKFLGQNTQHGVVVRERRNTYNM